MNEARQSIYKSIWKTCNDLRGAVDGWEFKNYVLGAMFYRWLSERLTSGQDVGCELSPSELFASVESTADKNNHLADDLARVIEHIESFDGFAGLFADFDLNSSKLGTTEAKRNERLAKLLHGIAGMELSGTGDAFGDAYEYLMTMYASGAGKSGGEFFTPLEVSELLAKIGIIGRKDVCKVYDPSCGSGSLLLSARSVLGGTAATFYGQDINATTYNLCRINMLLHGVPFRQFNIACEDTLTAPQHWGDQPFDLIVSNPPYSVRWVGADRQELTKDPRFAPAGVLAPKSKADMAFLMHCVSWLSNQGTAAIVCFPGILYRGGAELTIRKHLIEHNYVDAIIQLPSNLFFNTSISTVIVVLKKDKADSNILFVDASKEFAAQKKQNKLTAENIEHIVSLCAERQDVPYTARPVALDEIRENDWTLSVSTYIAPKPTREPIDIVALNAEVKELAERNNANRAKLDALVEEVEEMLSRIRHE